MNITTGLIALVATFSLLSPHSAQAQSSEISGAVFGLIDNNEWCPGGSVYVDLRTGDFMLHRRVNRLECKDTNAVANIEKGTLQRDDIRSLREAVNEAVGSGLYREECAVIITNGGPNQVTITVPGFSDTTPEEPGCWSDEAKNLHQELFRIFGQIQ